MIILLILLLSIFNTFKSPPTNKILVKDDVQQIIKYYNDMGHNIYAYEGELTSEIDTVKPIIVMFLEHKGENPNHVVAGHIHTESGLNILIVTIPDDMQIIKKR